MSPHTIYDVKARKSTWDGRGESPQRKADLIAEERATAAFEELEIQLDRLRTTGEIKLDDNISISVVTHDLGGKAGILAQHHDDLRNKFIQNYKRRELAAFIKNRRAG